MLGAHFEATENRFMNIGQGLGLGSALTDAAGDGRALGDQHSGFVAFEGHGEFHGDQDTIGREEAFSKVVLNLSATSSLSVVAMMPFNLLCLLEGGGTYCWDPTL